MKKNVYLIGLSLFLATSAAYCPVKRTCLDNIWLFLSKNIKMPSILEWSKMSDQQKKEWEGTYRNNPTLFMTKYENEAYIIALRNVLLQLPNARAVTEEERREVKKLRWEIDERLRLAQQ
jgi:RNAse (barnase) inhibitor barstar